MIIWPVVTIQMDCIQCHKQKAADKRNYRVIWWGEKQTWNSNDFDVSGRRECPLVIDGKHDWFVNKDAVRCRKLSAKWRTKVANRCSWEFTNFRCETLKVCRPHSVVFASVSKDCLVISHKRFSNWNKLPMSERFFTQLNLLGLRCFRFAIHGNLLNLYFSSARFQVGLPGDHREEVGEKNYNATNRTCVVNWGLFVIKHPIWHSSPVWSCITNNYCGNSGNKTYVNILCFSKQQHKGTSV